ncbi:MAG: glycine--tRNA ligase [Actinomycetota bacterium]
MPADLMDTIVSLAKRRGLIFPSSEIYGGVRSTWDYGPLGVELKNNVKRAWWRSTVQLRDDVVGLDAAILMNPKVWEASGHVESFSDPLVECLNCHHRFRLDHLEEAFAAKHNRPAGRDELTCPDCGSGPFTDPRNFNLMFKTHMGPVEDDSAAVWLRPETAQGIFVDFSTVQAASRMKIPFGIAQVGKSFRNEVTPGNFTFRTREFEQMELEFFVEAGTDEKWFERWVSLRHAWYLEYGIRDENLRLRTHLADELAHYARGCVDVEYRFPFGWSELEGIANRTDYDLTQHQKFSGEDLTYYDQENDRRYIPFVIEPSAGADRATLAFLVDAYREDEAPTSGGKMEKRVLLKLHKDLAPLKIAVLPLSRNERLVPTAKEVADMLRRHWMIGYDDAGSIGRRYRRQDEVGTPFAVTVDFDTMEDRAVTVRDRDTMTQDRVSIDRLVGYLRERLDLE